MKPRTILLLVGLVIAGASLWASIGAQNRLDFETQDEWRRLGFCGVVIAGGGIYGPDKFSPRAVLILVAIVAVAFGAFGFLLVPP